MKFGLLAAGSWGTAIGSLLAENEETYIWDVDPEVRRQVETGENKRYLPDVQLPENLKVAASAEEMLADVDAVVLAVPSHVYRKAIEPHAKILAEKEYVITLTKGFDPDSGDRLSEVYSRITDRRDNYFLLTGPSHAGEVARRRPTTVVIGGGDKNSREKLQKIFFRSYFRVYTNSDLIGLEMGGALKNIIAIAAGISDGLGFGVNARAALVTRGMNDLREVATYEGAALQTLYGLSGLGDLIVTATSDLSRNYSFGRELAGGKTVEEARDTIGQVVEGLNATSSAMRRIEAGNLRAPLLKTVHAVLAGRLEPEEAVKKLMNRPMGAEFDHEH